MPIYEYKCNDCGKVFELMQKFSDEPAKECVHCSGPVEKLISMSSFHLKGSGWYKTDNAPKREGSAEKCGEEGSKPECSGCPSS